ncbi:hypothetical protein E2C01_011355 [Portunus trituberculatus]|uniref:Uncharacterized protein n=1 Tax=Portunus trituberculatus TaxID=210409 RepID=A0A5B7DB68_PORTR|nr:hypothetical protein [Portunus trituberculatus]
MAVVLTDHNVLGEKMVKIYKPRLNKPWHENTNVIPVSSLSHDV